VSLHHAIDGVVVNALQDVSDLVGNYMRENSGRQPRVSHFRHAIIEYSNVHSIKRSRASQRVGMQGGRSVRGDLDNDNLLTLLWLWPACLPIQIHAHTGKHIVSKGLCHQ
jgi:hypothetical protein